MSDCTRFWLPSRTCWPGSAGNSVGVSSRKSGRETVWLNAARTFMSSRGVYFRIALGSGSRLLRIVFTGPPIAELRAVGHDVRVFRAHAADEAEPVGNQWQIEHAVYAGDLFGAVEVVVLSGRLLNVIGPSVE